jgi:DNA processing protein
VPGSPDLGWAALNLRLRAVPGLRREILSRPGGAVAALCHAAHLAGGDGGEVRWREAARAELERARSLGAGFVTPDDPVYPRLLRVAPDPPALLYLRGGLVPGDGLAIAVVGSRRATPHGEEVARRIAAGLAASGFSVVSGLARGIDAAAHRGALEAGGRTLAVLGSGLDRIYPLEHRKLAEEIAARGAVLTELPFGTAPLPGNFPERNRVIAWISWATVVVEAARDSGSLITARLAAEEGRAVAAVPGPVGEPNAEGTNALLRDGALLCRGAADLIEDLSPQLVEAAREAAAGTRATGTAAAAGGGETERPCGAGDPLPAGDEHLVLESLPATGGIGIEALGEATGLPPGRLLAALSGLEIRGAARALPGRRFMRRT